MVVLSDRLAGPVEGGTAHQEQNGVEDGQGQLQFIDGSIREGVHRFKGEVSRKEASEGHGVRHQKRGQAEHAVIGMLGMLGMLPVAVVLILRGNCGGHLPLLQRSRPLAAVRSSSSGGTP